MQNFTQNEDVNKKYNDLYDTLCAMRESGLTRPLGYANSERFKENGGTIIDDGIMTDFQIICRYFSFENTTPVIRYQFRDYFSAMRRFVLEFECRSSIPSSFFYFKYLKVLYNCKEEKEPTIVPDPIPKVEVRDEKVDFLGFYSEPKYVKMDEISDEYIHYVNTHFNMVERCRRYRAWLTYLMIPSHLGEITYDNPYEFVQVAEQQFGLYYEVLSKFKKENKGRKLFIPQDGLGYISMMCIALGIPYESYELYKIGRVAVKLGIISTSDVTILNKDVSGDVILLANLSNYYDLSSKINQDYIVIDENRLYPGVIGTDLKATSQYLVSSNVLTDTFISCSKQISSALPMIKDKYNIPLNSKAEAYLRLNGLKVYNNGTIKTCMPSYTLMPGLDKKKVRYITTSDFVKIVDLSQQYLNIINRNNICAQRGKPGEFKFKDGGYFLFTGYESELYTNTQYEVIKNHFYSHAYELRHWYKDRTFYISRDSNPQRKTYLIEDGQRKYIMYLHSFFSKKWGTVSVFTEKGDNLYMKREIQDIEEVSG